MTRHFDENMNRWTWVDSYVEPLCSGFIGSNSRELLLAWRWVVSVWLLISGIVSRVFTTSTEYRTLAAAVDQRRAEMMTRHVASGLVDTPVMAVPVTTGPVETRIDTPTPATYTVEGGITNTEAADEVVAVAANKPVSRAKTKSSKAQLYYRVKQGKRVRYVKVGEDPTFDNWTEEYEAGVFIKKGSKYYRMSQD